MTTESSSNADRLVNLRSLPVWQEYSETLEPTGQLVSMEQAASGILHGATHVVMWRPNRGSSIDPEILLQRRSDKVLTWPAHWEMSATGHIDAKETPHSAALRELKEEVGVDMSPEDVVEIFRHRSSNTVIVGTADSPKDIIENEVNIVHSAKWSDDTTLEHADGEVDSTRWVPLSKYLKWTGSPKDELLVPHDEEYVHRLAATVFYSMLFDEQLSEDRFKHPEAYIEMDESIAIAR